jgi:ribonucleoside-diphosphate reductase alpha chain
MMIEYEEDRMRFYQENPEKVAEIIQSKEVDKDFEDFDIENLRKNVRSISRLMDNVVELNNLPLKELQNQILTKRRHGLGFTGLGSTLNIIGLSYGSDDAIQFAEIISLIISQESLIANIELAKEKGCAPIFSSKESREAVLKSVYLQRLINSFDEDIPYLGKNLVSSEQIRKNILEFGLRYSHATSIAPTGTLSLTWGNNCSGGIEPEPADAYCRNVRVPGKKTKKQEEVMSYSYFMWKQKNGNKPLPDYWRTVKDLSIMDHLRMQAIVQKWVDSSISKTINVPADYPFEDFKKIYLEGWKLGLKGVTTYRPNASIGAGVLTQKSDLDATTYTFILEDGREVSFLGSEMVEYDGETHNVANLYDALKEGIYGNM